jgi:uncharacterized membrane protein
MTTASNAGPDSGYTNVNHPERWFSVVTGAALAAFGLKRRTTLGWISAAAGSVLLWRGATGHCFVYDALGISTADDSPSGNVSVPYGKGVRVEKSVTVNATPERLYSFWRNFENLPRFMSHLQSVTVMDSKRSHWKTKGPAGTDVEWDAEVINEVPNELIGWRSVEESEVNHAGSVHFHDTGRGTEVKVILLYDPPAGRLGDAIAKVFGEDAGRQVQEDLRLFKQLIETGETARTA